MKIRLLTERPTEGTIIEVDRDLLTKVTGIAVDETVLVFRDGQAVVQSSLPAETPFEKPESVQDLGTVDFKMPSGTMTGAELRKARLAQGSNKIDWANRIGIGVSTLNAVEENKPINDETKRKVEKALKIKLKCKRRQYGMAPSR